jgi:hypothetical protein
MTDGGLDSSVPRPGKKQIFTRQSSGRVEEGQTCLDVKPGMVPDLVPGIQGWKDPESLGRTWDVDHREQPPKGLRDSQSSGQIAGSAKRAQLPVDTHRGRWPVMEGPVDPIPHPAGCVGPGGHEARSWTPRGRATDGTSTGTKCQTKTSTTVCVWIMLCEASVCTFCCGL